MTIKRKGETTVLAVNDRSEQLDFMSALLGIEGYRVLAASNGHEGLEIARREHPHLIISDVVMPDGDGVELCRAIRADATLQTTPILLLSALHTDSESASEGLRAGADDYLEVPYDPVHLIAKVARLTDRATLEAALRESEERYRNLFENTPIGVYRTTPDGRILLANPTLIRLLGFSSFAELSARDIEREGYEPSYSRSGFKERLEREGEVRGLESAWIRYDKSIVHVRENARVVRAADGTVSYYEGTVEDITERNRALEALRENEERFRELFDEAPVGYHELDAMGRITRINRTELLMLGYSANEMLGHFVWEFAVDQDASRESVIAKLSGKQPLQPYERDVRRKDGTPVPVWIEERLLGDAQGGIIGIRTTIQDITARRNAEKALRESEEWLRTILDASRDGIIVEDDGFIFYVNQSYARLLGYDEPGELVGRHLSDVLPPDEAERMTEYGRRRLRGESVPSVYEFKAKRKDEMLVDVEGAVSTSVVGGKKYITTAIRDITERKRAEEALRESHKLLQSVIESTPDAVFVKDTQSRFLLVNSAVTRFLGKPMEEIVGHDDTELYPPETAREFIEADRKVITTGETQELEGIATAATGLTRMYLVTKSARRDHQGNIIGLIGISHDITERREAEEALRQVENQLRQSQKLESVGKLAGGIAHDFNNLLTAINGYSDLLLRHHDLPDDLRPKVQEIRKAGESAASLTHQLLAFSRKQILEPKVIDLNDVVTDTDKLLRRLIGENIELVTMRDPALGRIKADPNQLGQVIINLAVNARDAMPDGGKLTIETKHVYLDDAYARKHVSISPGHYVMLAVSDTGYGMDAATQQQIFEPFFTTKEVGKGTGLGLSTVYGIVRQSGGNIWVYSETGRGTTFKIYLPLIEKEAESMEQDASLPDLPRGTETVLVVEDNDAVRELARDILEIEGYTVLEASHGSGALSICERQDEPIDLLITDVVMPEMSGRQLVEHLAHKCSSAKVLYMSGYTDNAIVHHGVLDADTNFIQKPFTPDAFARKVREVLDTDQA